MKLLFGNKWGFRLSRLMALGILATVLTVPVGIIITNLNLDMEYGMSSIYLLFFAVFYILVIGKVWMHNREVREKREMKEILMTLNQTLQAIAKKLDVPNE